MDPPSSSAPQPSVEPGGGPASSSINSASAVSVSPLTAACERALTDKAYDKRKIAANEIEKYNINSYCA